MQFNTLLSAFAGFIALTAAQGCPTITIHDHGGCGSCTKTIDMITSTQSIDCGSCTEIATVTDRDPYFNCKIPCRGGFKTWFNEQGTTTVTACSTPTQG